MAMDPAWEPVVRAYLSAVDAEVPGLVEGLYLTGSVALDDFRPGASDLDFVALTRTSPTDADFSALARAHARVSALYPHPSLDGCYVTWRELASDPSLAAPGPQTRDGRLARAVMGARQPVTWHTVARHGIAMRGPDRADIEVWTDSGALAASTRQNLETYWRRWWRRSRRLVSLPGLAGLGSWAPAWAVLGVSRLHYTLATGEITSKHGAGRYARTAFESRWHPIIDECLRIRQGSPARSLYRSRLTRRREALAFLDMAIESALRIR